MSRTSLCQSLLKDLIIAVAAVIFSHAVPAIKKLKQLILSDKKFISP